MYMGQLAHAGTRSCFSASSGLGRGPGTISSAVTHTLLVPSLYQLILTSHARATRQLRAVVLAGESYAQALPEQHATPSADDGT